MPKVSFASKDAYEPKLGFQEGWFEIVDAKTQVYQYPANKETGEQSPPFLAAVLVFQRTDEQGNALDEEPQDRALRIEKDLTKMRPGQASSRDDQEPQDMGDELDAEGNCIFTEVGAKVNANSAWNVFCKSLEQAGFKSSLLADGYLPDLIGTKGHAVTSKGEKRQWQGREIEPAYLVVDKLTVKPYEKTAAKKPAGKAASNAGAGNTGAAKPNGAAAASNTAAAGANGAISEDAAEALATELITELAADLSGDTRDQKKLYAMAYSRLVKNKDRDKKLDKSVQDLLKNEEWLAAKGEETGLFTYADGVFTFGEQAA
jgi:hypothetical protein